MCIGKSLALMEIRMVTAHLLLDNDVHLAPGEDGQKLLYETMDHFTVTPGALWLVFSPREKI